jgi:hypothetical protein
VKSQHTFGISITDALNMHTDKTCCNFTWTDYTQISPEGVTDSTDLPLLFPAVVDSEHKCLKGPIHDQSCCATLRAVQHD